MMIYEREYKAEPIISNGYYNFKISSSNEEYLIGIFKEKIIIDGLYHDVLDIDSYGYEYTYKIVYTFISQKNNPIQNKGVLIFQKTTYILDKDKKEDIIIIIQSYSEKNNVDSEKFKLILYPPSPELSNYPI